MLQQVRTPDVFTLVSLAAAVLSISRSIEGEYQLAFALLPVAAVLDGVDGFVARLTKRQGDFGKALDSLVDFIAFGLTLSVFWLASSSRTGLDIAVVLLFSAAHSLRLAALIVKQPEEPNKGLPDLVVAMLFTLAYFLNLSQMFPLMFVAGAALMVLPFRFPKPRVIVADGRLGLRFE